MWNKTTYPFLVQALCIIPLKSIRMWASFHIFVRKTTMGASLNGPNSYSISEYYEDVPRNAINQMIQNP